MEKINGWGLSRQREIIPTFHSQKRPTTATNNTVGVGTERTTTTATISSGGRCGGAGVNCGSFHRLSWTVTATVHVALAVFLPGDHISWTTPFFAVGSPTPAGLRIHGGSAPVTCLQHWMNKTPLKKWRNFPHFIDYITKTPQKHLHN